MSYKNQAQASHKQSAPLPKGVRLIMWTVTGLAVAGFGVGAAFGFVGFVGGVTAAVVGGGVAVLATTASTKMQMSESLAAKWWKRCAGLTVACGLVAGGAASFKVHHHVNAERQDSAAVTVNDHRSSSLSQKSLAGAFSHSQQDRFVRVATPLTKAYLPALTA